MILHHASPNRWTTEVHRKDDGSSKGVIRQSVRIGPFFPELLVAMSVNQESTRLSHRRRGNSNLNCMLLKAQRLRRAQTAEDFRFVAACQKLLTKVPAYRALNSAAC
jgi:hypothetical protein